MSYKVISRFKDITDKNYIYEVGDTYPREGLEPTKDRIKILSTDKNKIGVVLIEEIEALAEEKPKKRQTRKKAE